MDNENIILPETDDNVDKIPIKDIGKIGKDPKMQSEQNEDAPAEEMTEVEENIEQEEQDELDEPAEKHRIKRKKRCRRALASIAILLAFCIIFGSFAAIFSKKGTLSNIELAASFKSAAKDYQLKPEIDEEGNYYFTTNGAFKILQLTDIHIGGGFMSTGKDAKALQAVATIVQHEKPDLVIVSGDIAYPVPFQAGTFNNKNGAKIFATLMETLHCYWTVSLGNHDTEAYSYYDRKAISEFYSSPEFTYCIYTPGPEDVDGQGNQIIKVVNTAGLIVQGIVILDSHSYTDGDILGIQWKYDNVHKNQVQWYEQQIEKMKSENVMKLYSIDDQYFKDHKAFNTVNSLLFLHIPLVEYKDAWMEFANNGYKDTEDVKYIEGIIGETGRMIYHGMHEDDLFEKILKLKSTKAVFCGHDHFNNITINYKGVDLSYGYSIDYLAYPGIDKEGSQRGATVIEIDKFGAHTISKYNLYSGRYNLPEGFDDDIVMQFEDVTFQYFEDGKEGITE
ncbi:MAG TPA: hypothetical protein GXZ23_01745 [Clostridiales bacterium]|mgnify:CR=1 FL=1|nr:hypothetical protein [Clostridiales bacterium]